MAHAANYKSSEGTERRRALLRMRFYAAVHDEMARITAEASSGWEVDEDEEAENLPARAAAAAAAAKERVIARGMAEWGRALDGLVEEWFRDWSRSWSGGRNWGAGWSRDSSPLSDGREGQREDDDYDDDGDDDADSDGGIHGYRAAGKISTGYYRKSGATAAGARRYRFTEVRDPGRKARESLEAARSARERAYRAGSRSASPLEKERIKKGSRPGISIFSRDKNGGLQGVVDSDV